MATYKGKIDLINMSEITEAAGINIVKTEILYAVSSNNQIPPDLANASLTIDDNDILSFQQEDFNFYSENGILWAYKDGKKTELSLRNGELLGTIGWSTEFPEVSSGQYLWIKTIFYYTDGTSTISYNVSYQGENGQPGPKGPQGTPFKILTNQTEILKFIDSNNQNTVSPEKLVVTIVKEDNLLSEVYNQVTNVNLTNFYASIRDVKSSEWIYITEPVIQLDQNFNFIIDLLSLMKLGDQASYPAANLLLREETILRIEYTHNWIEEDTGEKKRAILTEFVTIRYGMNKDMASLSLNAGGIVAAIQNSKMSFDANGLTIQNGGFKILNVLNDEVLYADTNGNLNLVGNIYANDGYFKGDITGATGTFSGRLEASEGFFTGELRGATGSFSGDISAASGTIGGFIIGEKALTSKAILNGAPAITLNGEEGNIFAENITLGSGAKIKDYISIGDRVLLKNAINPTDSFISVINQNSTEILSLKADGSIIAGDGINNIIINGAEGSMYSSNFSNGQGWRISNTNSIFNDVTVKGSIKASVLEYGQVQAIGGMLLVRPSSRILQIEPGSISKLTLESILGFEVGDWCLIDSGLIKNYYKIVSVNKDDNTLLLEGNVSINLISSPIVDFGKDKSVGIGINGSIDNSLITPQSISIFEFQESSRLLTPKIVLGKLPEEDQYGYAKGTYGLYAENVLLKGSLVTQTDFGNQSTTYSGISTLYSGGDSPNSNSYKKWFGDNTGEILLWAGANGTSKDEIEQSKFFVDRNGNLFAGSGYFKGTIITDAKIMASEIETAVLTGSGADPALTIRDAKLGISFQSEDKDVFKLTSDSIIANVDKINFNNLKINSQGNLIVPSLYIIGDKAQTIAQEENINKTLILDKTKIAYTNNFKENELSGSIKSFIDFENGIGLSPDGIVNALEVTEQQIQINNTLYISDTVKYNEIMEYKPVYKNGQLQGYDLYID